MTRDVDLRADGLLWLINRTVFHPRGFALAMVFHEGECTGFQLMGDGTEPWSFVPDDEPALFAAAQRALAPRFRLDDCGICDLVPTVTGYVRGKQVSCPVHGTTELLAEPECRVCSTGHVCHEHQAHLLNRCGVCGGQLDQGVCVRRCNTTPETS